MKDIKNEFESFVNDSASPAGSSFVLGKIQQQVQASLPSPWKVATKFGVAHLLGSLVTLMSCSQFGVQLFFDGGGLMHYFMQISPTFCNTFCGALYLSISFLMARFILNYDEWIMIRRSRVLSISILALVSLGALSMVSHEVTWEASLLWLFGAALGGEFMTLVKSPLLWLRQRTTLR